MKKKEDKNTRYFIDLDLKTRKIINWDYDQREKLSVEKLKNPFHHRVFISRGQYNQIDKKTALL